MHDVTPAMRLAARLRATGAQSSPCSPARLPALLRALRAGSVRLTAGLTDLSGTPVKITLESATPVTDDAAMRDDAPFMRTTYRLPPADAEVHACLPLTSLHRFVDVMFGGDGREADIDTGRGPSALECKICQRVADIVVGAIVELLGDASAKAGTFCRQDLVAISTPKSSGNWLALRYSIVLQETTASLLVLFPQGALHHQRDAPAETATPRPAADDPVWTRSLHREVKRASLVLQARIPEAGVTLADLAGLRVGSILALRASSRSTVDLACEGQTIFRGRLGQRDGAYTVQVIGSVDAPDASFHPDTATPIDGHSDA